VGVTQLKVEGRRW